VETAANFYLQNPLRRIHFRHIFEKFNRKISEPFVGRLFDHPGWIDFIRLDFNFIERDFPAGNFAYKRIYH
jgi:hypothetical protein